MFMLAQGSGQGSTFAAASLSEGREVKRPAAVASPAPRLAGGHPHKPRVTMANHLVAR